MFALLAYFVFVTHRTLYPRLENIHEYARRKWGHTNDKKENENE